MNNVRTCVDCPAVCDITTDDHNAMLSDPLFILLRSHEIVSLCTWINKNCHSFRITVNVEYNGILTFLLDSIG